MGTDVSAYRINLKKLREVCSKGKKHYLDILEKHKERLASLDESFHRGEEPARDLVSELLRGKNSDAWSAHKTAYALEVICRYIGEALPQGDELSFILRPFDEFFDFVALWNRTKIPFAINNIGEGKFNPPIPLHPPRDWPHIITFEADEVKLAYKDSQSFLKEDGPYWRPFHGQESILKQRLPNVASLQAWLDCLRFEALLDRSSEPQLDRLSAEIKSLEVFSHHSAEDWEEYFRDRVKDGFPKHKKFFDATRDLISWIELAAKAKQGIVMYTY